MNTLLAKFVRTQYLTVYIIFVVIPDKKVLYSKMMCALLIGEAYLSTR
jgi:hypothetical protein